jgi:hypothetical protein
MAATTLARPLGHSATSATPPNFETKQVLAVGNASTSNGATVAQWMALNQNEPDLDHPVTRQCSNSTKP